MSSGHNLKVKIQAGSRKKAMRRDKFKRCMNQSNLKTIMEESGSASEGESGYSSRSNSLTPPSSPPLRFGSHDQFRKFASGAGAGMSQNMKSPEVGMFHRDRRDQSRDKRLEGRVVGEEPNISLSEEKPHQSRSEIEALHCDAEKQKPSQLSVEELIELIEHGIGKCSRITQNLENLEKRSSVYGDRVLFRDYQLFPQTPHLSSFSFKSVLKYPSVSLSSL